MGVDEWDRKFAAEHYLFGTEPSDFLVAQRERLHPGMRALAVAEGEGRNAVWLAERGLEVLAVDGSRNALDKAERLAAERRVSIGTECVDLLAWDWPLAAFDLVVGVFFHVGPADRARVHRAMAEALKPGGLLLLEAFRPEQHGRGTGGPPDRERLFSAELLRQDFAGLEILELEPCEVWMDMRVGEHNDRTGAAAVIRLLARKPAA